MARKGQRRDLPPPPATDQRRDRDEARARRPRLSPLARTLLIAVCAPALVFGWFWLTTADFVSAEYAIDRWSDGTKTLTDGGQGVTLEVSAKPAFVLHQAPTGPSYSRLTFDLVLPRPPLPAVTLLYRRSAGSETRFGVYDLSRAIYQFGANRIVVPFDEVPGLLGCDQFGLSLSCAEGATQATLANARLASYSHGRRLVQMLAALLRPQPFSQGSNNFVPAQKVAGRGFPFFFWIGLLVAALALLVRRLALRESFPIATHFAITALVLFALMDLRNGVDYATNARAALSLRLQSKDVYEQLAGREAYFPWFGDAVRAIAEGLPDGGRYYLKVAGAGPGFGEAVARARYYARPAVGVADPQEADLAVLYRVPLDGFENAPEWRKETASEDAASAGVVVYRRVK